MRSILLSALSILTLAAALPSDSHQRDDRVRDETGVQRVHDELGLTGDGVIVVVLDRGIDVEHPDFRNPDGTTRLLAVYDMMDPSGASDPDNSTGIGTVYTQAEIDAALSSSTRLAHRDASGHGTATAGLAAGNGRASSGLYAGMAPDADIVVVKITSEGAPAHGSEPAEASFYDPTYVPIAMDFVLELAEREGKPVVLIANFGSSGGPMDGTSTLARTVDERFGPGKPGRVFISGTSDDGGVDNHASGTVSAGQTVDLKVRKATTGTLVVDIWTDKGNRFDVSIVTPSGTSGPYTAPTAESLRDTKSGTGFFYAHNGADVDYYGAENDRREIYTQLTGPPGDYTIRLTATAIRDGLFQASVNPSATIYGIGNRFESFVTPGHTVWMLASARQNLSINSYVLRDTWTDVNGATQTYTGNDGGPGSLWTGSGVGPTYDGRLGVSVSAPGNSNIGPYAPRSFFATLRFNLVTDGAAPYGVLSAVSGAAPIVAGSVALLLEADPTLDAAEVRDALEQTARADAQTGAVPNSTWGYGKMDVFAAAQRVIAATDASSSPNTAALDLTVSPHPVRQHATLHLTLDAAAPVRVELADALGRRVALVHDGPLPAGRHQLAFDADGLAPGLYLAHVQVREATISRQIVVTR
ncbi:MAG: hypothetical protein Rubg2KO_26390 [Rubricoccaceae bacterium]